MIEKRPPLISVLVPARGVREKFIESISTLYSYFSTHFDNFEIIVIPNGNRYDDSDKIHAELKKLSKTHKHLRICTDRLLKPGKGAALNAGFRISRGDWIFWIDADLPYALSFFREASTLLSEGIEFVSGNRRQLKPSAGNKLGAYYPSTLRNNISIAFNSIARRSLKIESHDTQAGIKSMTRKFASNAFRLQNCPGFLFDLEFFLIARLWNIRRSEIPVFLNNQNESSTINFFIEIPNTINWLLRIWRNLINGRYDQNISDWTIYDSMPKKVFYDSIFSKTLITADDWGLSPAVNQGILRLAEAGIIRRVSVLVDAQFAQLNLDRLKAIEGLEIGLHFNLTYKTRFRSPLLLTLGLLNPFTHTEVRLWIRSEFNRQIELLRSWGINPSHFDGHHHVHVFPRVAPEIAELAFEYGIKKTRLPWSHDLWLSSKMPLWFFCRWTIPVLHKFDLKYWNFSYPRRNIFKKPNSLFAFLKRVEGHEVLCHPAIADDLGVIDSVEKNGQSRIDEYKAFHHLSRQLNEQSFED